MEDRRQEKLKSLVVEHHERLVAVLLHMARKRGFRDKDAEDVVQSAFEHFLVQIERGNLYWILNKPNPAKAIEYFLLTFSFKAAFSKIGRLKGPIGEVNPDDLPSDLIDNNNHENRAERCIAIVIDLERAIAQLPEEHQQILTWHYVEGWSCKEIAERLHTTQDAIAQKLYRIRKRLCKILRSSYGEEITN